MTSFLSKYKSDADHQIVTTVKSSFNLNQIAAKKRRNRSTSLNVRLSGLDETEFHIKMSISLVRDR